MRGKFYLLFATFTIYIHFIYIQQIHFAPEMWERPRIDGKKKLKSCAIPTIFSSQTNTNMNSISQMDSTSVNVSVCNDSLQ